jgi:hypothetical protein
MTTKQLAGEMESRLTFGLHFTIQFALYMRRVSEERQAKGQHGFDRWPVDLEEYQQRLCGVHVDLSQGLHVVNWTLKQYGLPSDIQKAVERIIEATNLAGVHEKHFETLWTRLDPKYYIRMRGRHKPRATKAKAAQH